MFLWRGQSWDLPQAMFLEAEPGLEWRVWEQNLPQLVFSEALGVSVLPLDTLW